MRAGWTALVRQNRGRPGCRERRLGLIEATGTKPTEAFRKLVKARMQGEDDYQSELLEIVNSAYDKIVGNVDIDHGTLGELEKAFKDYGVPVGQMLQKTVRFYVKVLQDCGITPSPHITKPRRVSNGGSRKASVPKAPRAKKPDPAMERHQDDHGGTPAPEHRLPQGAQRLPVPGVENAYIQYPNDLTEADCALFEAIVGVLRTYAKGRSGGTAK